MSTTIDYNHHYDASSVEPCPCSAMMIYVRFFEITVNEIIVINYVDSRHSGLDRY